MEFQNKTTEKIVNAVLPCLFWLGVWHLCAYAVHSNLLIASPRSVFRILISEIVTAKFWVTVISTLARIRAGFLIAAAVSVPLSVLCVKFPLLRMLVSPVISVIRATPVASFILFLLVWCRNSRVPVIIVFLMVMPVLWQNITRGIENTDRELLEMAQVFEFSPIQTAKLVYIPSVKPYFVSAVLSCIGLAWKSGVAAEVLCTPENSIGKMIYNAKVYLETPQLFAWTLTVIAISLLIEKAVSRAVKHTAGGDANG